MLNPAKPPPYHSVVDSVLDNESDGTHRPSGSTSRVPQLSTTPLLVIWESQRVAIRRQPSYTAAITAIKNSRAMEELQTLSFYLKAIIPGCGDELCEILEDMWSDLVFGLPSVTVAVHSRTSQRDSLPTTRCYDESKGADHISPPTTRVNTVPARVPPPPIRVPVQSNRITPTPTPVCSPTIDVPRNTGPYVILKPLIGQQTILSISSRDISVWELKNQIYAEQGIPADQQRLVFVGKQLEDRQTLRKSGVPLGSTIDLRRIGLRGDALSPDSRLFSSSPSC